MNDIYDKEIRKHLQKEVHNNVNLLANTIKDFLIEYSQIDKADNSSKRAFVSGYMMGVYSELQNKIFNLLDIKEEE